MLSKVQTAFLWVETRDGVSWFDGYRFHTLGSEMGVPEQVVEYLASLPNGKMALSDGRALYVGGQSGFEPANLPFAIHSMAASATGASGLLSKEAGVLPVARLNIDPYLCPRRFQPRMRSPSCRQVDRCGSGPLRARIGWKMIGGSLSSS